PASWRPGAPATARGTRRWNAATLRFLRVPGRDRAAAHRGAPEPGPAGAAAADAPALADLAGPEHQAGRALAGPQRRRRGQRRAPRPVRGRRGRLDRLPGTPPQDDRPAGQHPPEPLYQNAWRVAGQPRL